jgi:hypothetical protein
VVYGIFVGSNLFVSHNGWVHLSGDFPFPMRRFLVDTRSVCIDIFDGNNYIKSFFERASTCIFIGYGAILPSFGGDYPWIVQLCSAVKKQKRENAHGRIDVGVFVDIQLCSSDKPSVGETGTGKNRDPY